MIESATLLNRWRISSVGGEEYDVLVIGSVRFFVVQAAFTRLLCALRKTRGSGALPDAR
jgi:hypothetical protein